jgi:hypothetical protein
VKTRIVGKQFPERGPWGPNVLASAQTHIRRRILPQVLGSGIGTTGTVWRRSDSVSYRGSYRRAGGDRERPRSLPIRRISSTTLLISCPFEQNRPHEWLFLLGLASPCQATPSGELSKVAFPPQRASEARRPSDRRWGGRGREGPGPVHLRDDRRAQAHALPPSSVEGTVEQGQTDVWFAATSGRKPRRRRYGELVPNSAVSSSNVYGCCIFDHIVRASEHRRPPLKLTTVHQALPTCSVG